VNKKILAFGVIVFFIIICLSGCENTQNTNADTSKFIGTWIGNLEISMFGSQGNSTITQLTFIDNEATAVMTSSLGSRTMNYTYALQGSNLILAPKFGDFGGHQGGRPPFNGTQPPGNHSWPINGSQPWNGSRPPYNGSWQSGQQPGGGRFSMNISLTYQFNEDNTVVYLNESEFSKIH